MKKTFLIVLIAFISKSITAQTSRFKDYETLNVWASSGLNMRDKPDAKAVKVATVPYGAKVTVQANIGIKIPFEVEEFKGFIVKGYWLLVKYGDREGFVFDGFLSRLPAPIPTEHDLSKITYLSLQIKKVGKAYNVEKCKDLDFLKDKCKYSQRYNFGIECTFLVHPEVGGSFELKIPNISIYEAYFLVVIHGFSPDYDKKVYNPKNKTVSILPIDEGVGCHTTIQQKDNVVIIDNYCGC